MLSYEYTTAAPAATPRRTGRTGRRTRPRL